MEKKNISFSKWITLILIKTIKFTESRELYKLYLFQLKKLAIYLFLD
ncbi:hypothetical protein PcaKH15_01620 [Parageobacillus caldoxylosilyticus]|jgi:hypothetical protein|uniref:Uncharacterized protein n=1 Tax=Parageobacillus caldoxylosilyticus NBRC 107762 TaxID=1220594 RepID=A0A023DEY2_9BACL|nr:hypothetical protein [Parageobacillus caldoxylosilyticus]BDG34256.1 hypothetical protein PcaKH15_01620 [Parageobacillus caldoxylosilyticus]BDG38024.1 hypothetical protein PcaKH16_01630 [Parageobacillus caldoxylosilyticus]GAJ39839.1 hypothetical protein GCA01S_029_00170 [Parageobacillus caldoxylosilyticus NBRC 107762]